MEYKTLGILGGGQLGRMSAQAAQTLDLKIVIFTPEKNAPASKVADQTITADYDDKKALEEEKAARQKKYLEEEEAQKKDVEEFMKELKEKAEKMRNRIKNRS